jgi:hypothetical protein
VRPNAREKPLTTWKPAETAGVRQFVQGHGSGRVVIEEFPRTSDRDRHGWMRLRGALAHKAVHQQDQRFVAAQVHLLFRGVGQCVVEHTEGDREGLVPQNRTDELAGTRSTLVRVADRLSNESGVNVEHPPRAPGGPKGSTVMDLARIDGDEVAGPGLDDTAPAQGALCTSLDEPEPELLVKVAWERMAALRLYGEHTRHLAGHDLEPSSRHRLIPQCPVRYKLHASSECAPIFDEGQARIQWALRCNQAFQRQPAAVSNGHFLNVSLWHKTDFSRISEVSG